MTEWLLIKGAARDPFDICGGIYSPRGISQGLCGGSYPLVRAAMQKDGTILKVLLRHGARADSSRKANYPEVHWRTIGRVTSLHVAAYHRCFENVRVLVVNGADFERLANFAEDSCVYSERFLTPREAVKEGLKYRKVHEESEDGDETEGRTLEEKAVVVAALAEFDLAVRRALEERRLLVLGCLRARARRLPSVPSHLLKCIFESAKLSYSAR